MRTMTERDIGLWTDIQRDAEPWIQISDHQFEHSFGDDWEAAWQRCFLVISPRGRAEGTVSAWKDEKWQGGEWGRIHWLAIRPEFQRMGLAKAATAYSLDFLADHHKRAYLDTQSNRLAAIRLYRSFGFQPHILSEEDTEIWADVEQKEQENFPQS